MERYDCFTANVSIQKSRPIVETDKKSVLDFTKSKWYSLFNPVIMQADPFLFVKDDTLFLFYEEMGITGSGVIKMVKTNNLKDWSKPLLITHEPTCHFSYPFVFEIEGEVYMMPETGVDHNVRLYKAKDKSLTSFELYKIILERPTCELEGIKIDFADSCIYSKGNMYYLFTSFHDGDRYQLELYISDRFDGGYTKHPMSPICVGDKLGRCGGSLIEVDGKLYRPAQDCDGQYGGQIHLLEIDEITPKTYIEHLVRENVLPRKSKMYKEGGHHINFTNFKGQNIIASDYKSHCTFILERMRLKICRILELV